MKKLLLILIFALTTNCFTQNVISSTDSLKKPQVLSVNDLADVYVKNLFRFYPEWGTYYGVENADHIALSDNTAEGLMAEHAAEDSLYALVKTIDTQRLSKNDLITFSILKETLESSIATRVCKKNLWSMNQMDGFYIWFRYIGNTQPVGDSTSRAAAISRWRKIPQFIENDMINNRIGMESGYALPKVIVNQVIDQLDQLLKGPLESNVFYIPAMRDSSSAFKNEMKSIVQSQIMPVIETYKNFLTNEYLTHVRDELSISSIPNGNECYEASLRSNTTLSVGPEKIFEWGEQAIALREQTIIDIGTKVYGESEIQKIKEAFKSDSSNYFSSKEGILALAESAISRAKEKISNYFGLIPKTDVILEPIPEIEEKTGYSRYLPASDDGSRPATYLQQTYRPKTRIKGEVESTAFHETYPGHHLQIAISRELVKSHPITKYVGNSGFVEGWARYTETLSDEMKLYSSEKNRLAMYMGLPTGMVVDPGIHYKNWSREKAIEYTLKKQAGMTREDAERYVDRISVWPGQMTTYGVGEMYFLNLRKEAEEQLGQDFNIKEFHDECLRNGSVPLNFVNDQVKEWMHDKKQ